MTDTEESKNWWALAKKKVAWYDPLINRPDPILTDQYKTNLIKELKE